MLSRCLAVVTTALSLATGCKGQQAAGPVGPVEVGVVKLAPRAITLTRELPGRTSAFRVAEVRARVSGIVLKRLFTEGVDVKEGQVLYLIDPAPYQAARASAKAQLAHAEATASNAQALQERDAELVGDNAVSREEHDNAVAAQKASEADVAAAKAAVDVAQISLGIHSRDGARLGAHRPVRRDRGRLRPGRPGDTARHRAAARPRVRGRDAIERDEVLRLRRELTPGPAPAR